MICTDLFDCTGTTIWGRKGRNMSAGREGGQGMLGKPAATGGKQMWWITKCEC